MHNVLKRAAGWIVKALAEEITKPINKQLSEQGAKLDAVIQKQDRLETRMTALHESDAAALEADLSVMDDRICYLIGICRQRGYTTAEERRRITRMHKAYRAIGGNHGEENEFSVFQHLPTEEEFMRTKGA